MGVSRWHHHANVTNKQKETNMEVPWEDNKEEAGDKIVRGKVRENGSGLGRGC